MRNHVEKRACSGTSHEFDSISINREIEVRPANGPNFRFWRIWRIEWFREFRSRNQFLVNIWRSIRECILTFSRRQRLLGGMAFLYLNSRGHDALILDEISLTHPDSGPACLQAIRKCQRYTSGRLRRPAAELPGWATPLLI